jgi:hypothetical protein
LVLAALPAGIARRSFSVRERAAGGDPLQDEPSRVGQILIADVLPSAIRIGNYTTSTAAVARLPDSAARGDDRRGGGVSGMRISQPEALYGRNAIPVSP